MKSKVVALVLVSVVCLVSAVFAQQKVEKGTVVFDDGSILNLNGKVYLDGTQLTATAAEINAGFGSKSTTGVTNVTQTLSRAVITATAAVTAQRFALTNVYDGVTNTLSVMTNATVAVTVVNGDLVVTNAVLTLQR
jgi:hypothetical protein